MYERREAVGNCAVNRKVLLLYGIIRLVATDECRIRLTHHSITVHMCAPVAKVKTKRAWCHQPRPSCLGLASGSEPRGTQTETQMPPPALKVADEEARCREQSRA
jgi:hypothetical protein